MFLFYLIILSESFQIKKYIKYNFKLQIINSRSFDRLFQNNQSSDNLKWGRHSFSKYLNYNISDNNSNINNTDSNNSNNAYINNNNNTNINNTDSNNIDSNNSNKILNLSQKYYNGYDMRNISEKYISLDDIRRNMLKKEIIYILEDKDISIFTKLEIIDNYNKNYDCLINLGSNVIELYSLPKTRYKNYTINMHNGGLFNDWNFNF